MISKPTQSNPNYQRSQTTSKQSKIQANKQTTKPNVTPTAHQYKTQNQRTISTKHPKEATYNKPNLSNLIVATPNQME